MYKRFCVQRVSTREAIFNMYNKDTFKHLLGTVIDVLMKVAAILQKSGDPNVFPALKSLLK